MFELIRLMVLYITALKVSDIRYRRGIKLHKIPILLTMMEMEVLLVVPSAYCLVAIKFKPIGVTIMGTCAWSNHNTMVYLPVAALIGIATTLPVGFLLYFLLFESEHFHVGTFLDLFPLKYSTAAVG